MKNAFSSLVARSDTVRVSAPVVALAGFALLATPTIAQSSVTAAPGAIVRWSSAGTTGCVFQDEVIAPHGDDCYFTIDLDTSDGPLRAERTRNGAKESLQISLGDYPYTTQHLTIKDTRRVNVNEEDGARAARERKRIVATFELRSPRTFELPLSPPLEKLPQGGRFGAKRIINGEPRSPHTGSDFAASRGTPVLAAADGIVRLAEEHFFGGNSVFLDHGDGLITMYLHLHESFVKAGQELTRGAVLGTVGSTGRSTGPHLHFGIRWRGARVDPSMLLKPQRIPTAN